MEETPDEIGLLRRKENLLRGRNRVLQMLAQGAPLLDVLEALCLEAERAFPELQCCIQFLDRKEGRLRHGASPSLPESYIRALDGLEIGPAVGSCGAAAYLGRRVIIDDVMTHPNWAAFRDLAAAAGIRACWSEPIHSTTHTVLGAFAMYHTKVREPTPTELELIGRMVQIAGIAIEHELAKTELRDSEERFRQVTETIHEVFWLSDWKAKALLYVSPAYEEIWGRTRASLEADPRSWTYDIHPEDRDRVVALVLASEQPYETEYRIVREDGTVRWIFERSIPIRDEVGVVYRIAGISEDVTTRKKTEEALRQANHELDSAAQRKLRSLTTELLLAEERERRKLAIDLHDTLNQTLVLAKMKVAELGSSPSQHANPVLAEVERLLSRATESARSMTFQLSPPILYDLGFGPAVQWLVEDIQESYSLKTRLHEAGHELHLDDRVKILLFRAVRELLINVAKHARAQQAVVRIARRGDSIEISVRDDGVAFDGKNRSRRGLGLDSIDERLQNLGGRMSIEAERGKGTCITLVAPLATRDGTDAVETGSALAPEGNAPPPV